MFDREGLQYVSQGSDEFYKKIKRRGETQREGQRTRGGEEEGVKPGGRKDKIE